MSLQNNMPLQCNSAPLQCNYNIRNGDGVISFLNVVQWKNCQLYFNSVLFTQTDQYSILVTRDAAVIGLMLHS